MRFLSNSIRALFLGGFLGVFFWSFSNGTSISSVPVYLIAVSFSALAWAWAPVWLRKSSQNDWARLAGVCFTGVMIGFPVLGAFLSADTGQVEGQFLDLRLLMSLLKWMMIAGLIFSTICSFVSIWLSHKVRMNTTKVE